MGAWNGDHRRRDSDRAAPVPADTATARLGGWRVSVGDLQTRDGHHPGPAPADVSSDRSGARGTLRLRLRLPGRAPTSAVGDGQLTDWLGRTPASESSSGRARRSPRVRLITPTVIRNDAAATPRQTRSCEAARPRGPALTGGPSPGGPMSSVSDNWTTTPAPGRLPTDPGVDRSFVDVKTTSRGVDSAISQARRPLEGPVGRRQSRWTSSCRPATTPGDARCARGEAAGRRRRTTAAPRRRPPRGKPRPEGARSRA
ncbi:MAG: hypothetical protein HW391_1968 [Chloroflexi bacterium]|nr:hypothetical protein [Chloroflexota bacterium]